MIRVESDTSLLNLSSMVVVNLCTSLSELPSNNRASILTPNAALHSSGILELRQRRQEGPAPQKK